MESNLILSVSTLQNLWFRQFLKMEVKYSNLQNNYQVDYKLRFTFTFSIVLFVSFSLLFKKWDGLFLICYIEIAVLLPITTVSTSNVKSCTIIRFMFLMTAIITIYHKSLHNFWSVMSPLLDKN